MNNPRSNGNGHGHGHGHGNGRASSQEVAAGAAATATPEGVAWRAQAFDRLRGTIKGYIDETVAPLQFWYGENQSGKSGRIITVRYALGGVSAWTLGVHGSAIATLAPEGAEEFYAHLSGPSGSSMFRVPYDEGVWREPEKLPELEGELKSYMTPEHRRNVLPLVEMSELLDYGSDRGRRALMERFGNADTVPAPLGLEGARAALWADVLGSVTTRLTKKDPSTHEVVRPDASLILVEMNKAFAARKLEEGKAVTTLNKTLDERRAKLTTAAAGSELLPGLRAQLGQAKAWESAAHIRTALEALERDKVAYREATAPLHTAKANEAAGRAATAAEREALSQTVRGLHEALRLFAVELATHDEKLQKGQLLLSWLPERVEAPPTVAGATPAACTLCQTTTVVPLNGAPRPYDPTELRNIIAPMVANRIQLRAATAAQQARAEEQYQTAMGALQAFDAQQRAPSQLDKEVARWTQEATRILATEKALIAATPVNVPAQYTGPGSAALVAEIDRLESADRARKQLEEDTAEVRRHKDLAALAKDLEGESKLLGDALIAQVQATAEACVNRYMPDGLQAVLDLDKKVWNVLDKTGAARTKHTMSGFELNALVPALAAAYTEGSPCRVLALDDPDLDGVGLENVQRFFGSLAAAVQRGWLTQVFAAGNRFEPALDQLRALGWNVTQVNAAKASAPTSIGIAPTFAELYHPDGVPRL